MNFKFLINKNNIKEVKLHIVTDRCCVKSFKMMKKIFIITIIMFSFFNKTNANYEQLAHEFNFKSIDGGEINLQNYKEKVIVVVNVASRCGFTPQYEDLQKFMDKL